MKTLKLLLKNIKYICLNDLSKYPSANITYQDLEKIDNKNLKKFGYSVEDIRKERLNKKHSTSQLEKVSE